MSAASAQGLAGARARCGLAYLVALSLAALVLWRLPHSWVSSSLWRVVVADVAGTLAVFAFSLRFDNSSFYDAYWSVAPIAMALWWLVEHNAFGVRQLVVLAVIALWGVRLTYNWLRHWQGLQHEDWRYVDLRHKTGRAYWLVSMAGIHLFPTAMVMAAMVPVYVVMTSHAALAALDLVALVVSVGAIVIETVADRQLHDFVHDNDDPQRILDRGLWAWSRHPNYFGETSFWWGVSLFALATQPDAWWTCIIGAAAISALFFFISIPLIDERMLNKRPHYRDHMRKVSRLVPWPPRR